MELDVSLVTRVTEKCNAKCTYCYMSEKQDKDLESDSAEKLIAAFLGYNKKYAHFTWIGGEPLIRPDSFFKELVEFSKKHNKKDLDVSHSIQTNGIGLTPERREYLKSLGFKIGVSYDGTLAIQNELRQTKNGKFIGLRVLENLQSSKKTLPTISVITRLSLGKEKEIYSGLKEITSAASLNFYAPTGEGLLQKDRLLPSKEEASSLMTSFYTLWRDDDSLFLLYPYKNMARSFFTGMSRACEFSAISCFQIVGADTEGNIYTCSRSAHIPETRLGNIHKESIEEILENGARGRILDRYLHLKSEGCKWFTLCCGGCPVEALSHTGNFMNKTYYCCEAKGAVFAAIEKDLNDEKFRNRLARKAGVA